MHKDLESRFIQFLDTLSDAENLDAAHFQFPNGIKKADFLLNNRKIIAEIKTIKQDQKLKADNKISEFVEAKKLVIFGSNSLAQLAESHQETLNLENSIRYAISRNIEQICRSAKKQIIQTALNLHLEALGLLIILNQSVEILTPEIILNRIKSYITKNNLDTIQYCILIDEYAIDSEYLYIYKSNPKPHDLDKYLFDLMTKWAIRNQKKYKLVITH